MLALLRRSPSLRSFRHRPFRRMAAANLASITGTWMQMIAQSWVVLQLTGSTAALGGSVALQAAPSVVLGLWGGSIVDRVDKRRLLIGTQVVLAGLAAALAIVASGPFLTLGVMYALALVTGVVHVLDGPANAAFGVQLVGTDDLANAVALGSAINSTGRILGMALGGAMVAAVGPGAVFWLNAATYLVVSLVLWRLPTTELAPLATADADNAGIRQGLRVLLHTPGLLVLVGVSFVSSTFGRNFQVTMVAMTESAFGLDAAAYGFVSTVFAVGGLVGAAYATRLARPTANMVLRVAAIAAALEAMAGFTPGLRSFATIMLGVGATAVVLDTVMTTHVQLAVNDEYRGRMLSVLGLAGKSGSTLGAPLLGLLADVFGARAALLVGATVCAAAVIAARTIIAARSRAEEAVDTIEDLPFQVPDVATYLIEDPDPDEHGAVQLR